MKHGTLAALRADDRQALLARAGALALIVLLSVTSGQNAQARAPDAADWQAAAGGKMSFDVASVKPSTFTREASFPLDDGNAYVPGGRLVASFPPMVLHQIAYKLGGSLQERAAALAHLPKWVDSDLFEIEARAQGNPTKDQMRLMMQSLLADRFKLKVHFETNEAPVFALTLVKPGTLGPKLLPHQQGPPCPDSYTPPAAPPSGGTFPSKDVFPPNCNSGQTWARNGVFQAGARNVPVGYLANSIYNLGVQAGEVDKPVLDKTGLTGAYDYTIVYAPGSYVTYTSGCPISWSPLLNVAAEPKGPLFLDAVRQQLGLRLEPSKGPIRSLVIDHVEKPASN